MFLKKTILLGAAFVIINLPLISKAAELTTLNNTNETSAVKITSNVTKVCSGLFPNGATLPHQKLSTPWPLVNFLCSGSGSICTADIYATKDCTGAVIASATLDLKNPNVTITQIYNPNYIVSGAGTTVTIDYASF